MEFQATHRHPTPLFNLHRYVLPVLVIVGDDARHDDVVKVVEGGKPVAFVGSDHPTQKQWVVYDDHQPDRCCVL